MPEPADDMEKLLVDVRKTISDNRLFLEKLLDEKIQEKDDEQDESDDTIELAAVEEEFEEL